MSGAVEMISGEPLRLSETEWARIGDIKIKPPAGPARMGFAICEAIYDRDPLAPLMTHDEYTARKSV